MEIPRDEKDFRSNNRRELSFHQRLTSIQRFVSELYRASGMPKEQREKFDEHNRTILVYATGLAKEANLCERDLQTLQLAAALHDVSKGDVPLVKHGFESAKIARRQLKQMGFDNETIERASNAIERHMGPIPGFMAQEAVRWEQKTGERIEFPRPQTELDKLLYDSDMLSLIDKQGIDKILAIRENVDIFRDEDIRTAKESGITPKEAAWLSALKSGKEAANSLFTDVAKAKAEKLLDNANKRFNEFKASIKE